MRINSVLVLVPDGTGGNLGDGVMLSAAATV